MSLGIWIALAYAVFMMAAEGARAAPTVPPEHFPDENTTIYNDIYFTFYGYDDNDDGHGHTGTAVIAFPTVHAIATEDLGSFEHPSTLAADTLLRFVKPGQKVYVPKIRKYYVMEDGCVECSEDMDHGLLRLDLFIGPNTGLSGPALIGCEDALTTSTPYIDQAILNPGEGLPVESHPLFSHGTCFFPSFSLFK